MLRYMEFNRNYQAPGQVMSGMFCTSCGRPTILSSGLCPSCCNDRYEIKQRNTLPEIPDTNYSHTVQNTNSKGDLE